MGETSRRPCGAELEEVVAVAHRILTMSRGRIIGEMESHDAPTRAGSRRHPGGTSSKRLPDHAVAPRRPRGLV